MAFPECGGEACPSEARQQDEGLRHRAVSGLYCTVIRSERSTTHTSLNYKEMNGEKVIST